ncbi:MAG: tetratricopeptide repeat protein [Acidobacteria bacterium]|nr:MAG: tetratricopeptide repeat protein [Acidobacteriota bacterium]
MNKPRKVIAIGLLILLFGPTMGCSRRLLSGIRKYVVKPAAYSVKSTVAGVRTVFRRPGRPSPNRLAKRMSKEVKPIVMIEDSAGYRSHDERIAPDEAAHYRELAIVKPYDPVVRYNMGRLYLQQGLLEEASYEFDMATSLDPRFTYGFVLLGRTLRMRGLYDLAIAKLRRAIQLQPDLPVAYIELGVCWDERGHHDKAREAYFKALALAPNDSRIYNNIGYSYFLEEEYKNAIKYYKKALQLDPDDLRAHDNIALAYAMREKWDKALIHFTRALGEAAAQNNVGHLLLRAGRIDEALAHLERAVHLDPTSVPALGNLESALRLKGRIDEAEKIHTRLLEAERLHRPVVTTSLESASR